MWCALIVLFVTAVFLLDRLGDRVVSRMASKREIAWARHNLEERGFVPYEDTYMTEQCIKAVEAGILTPEAAVEELVKTLQADIPDIIIE